MEFIETIESELGMEAKKDYLPMQKGDVERTWADVSKLQRHYGYAPSTPLREGVRKFVEWYREYYKV